MKRIVWLTIVIIVTKQNCFAQQTKTDPVNDPKGKLIYADDFTGKLDTATWIVEMAPAPNSKVYVQNGNLVLDTKGGVTVWFNRRLTSNVRIEYDRQVVVAGGVNDRLSDLNQFWMAQDPQKANLFTRSGVLESYDSLQLYYVGMGGNTNSTNRFRKYEGNGQRTLIQDYTDKAHLLEANKIYHISIVVNNGVTSFWVDYQCYFTYKDPAPFKEGYFGFRSTKSHQEISKVRIYQLP
jgi:rhamnogalacturonan endolyase